jgi:hypothetical protein
MSKRSEAVKREAHYQATDARTVPWADWCESRILGASRSSSREGWTHGECSSGGGVHCDHNTNGSLLTHGAFRWQQLDYPRLTK